MGAGNSLNLLATQDISRGLGKMRWQDITINELSSDEYLARRCCQIGNTFGSQPFLFPFYCLLESMSDFETI